MSTTNGRLDVHIGHQPWLAVHQLRHGQLACYVDLRAQAIDLRSGVPHHDHLAAGTYMEDGYGQIPKTD